MGDSMNLDRCRSIEEHPDHFVVDHETRGRYRIAKKVLPADIIESIRSVAKGKAAAAQAIANAPGPDGVTRAAEGADVGAEPADPTAIGGPPPQFDPGVEELLDVNRPSTAAPFAPAPPTAPYPAADLARLGLSPEQAREAAASYGSGETTAAAADFGRLGINPQAFGLHAPPMPSADALAGLVNAAQANAAKDTAAYDAAQSAPDVPSTPAIPGSVPPADIGAVGVPPAQPPQITPFDASPLDEANRRQQAAIEEHGRIQSQLALAQKGIQDQTNAAMHELALDYNGRIDRNNTRLQTLADDIASKPIHRKDPGWAGAIAVALGAFGSALSRTPNFALQIINKRIDDDLAVQREERANKRNQIAFYRDQGLSLENAARLAKADKLAEAAGAMQAAAYQAGSQQAIATAKEASAKLLSDAFRLTQEAHLNDFKLKSAPIALQSELRTAQIQQAQGLANLRLANLQAAQAPARAAQENALTRLKMAREVAETDKALSEADNAKRTGAVNFPVFQAGADGEPVIVGMQRRQLVDSRDQKTGEEITRAVGAIDTLRRVREFFAPGFRAGPTSNQEWATLKNELLGLVKKPGDNSNADVDRLAEALPSASSWSQIAGKSEAGIKALERQFLSHLRVLERQNLE